MSADSLGLGRLLYRFKCVARSVPHSVIGLSLVAATMSDAASAQVQMHGFESTDGQNGPPFQLAPNDEEFTGQVDAIHSPNIDRMPKARYKLDVARRHSQLIITRRKVRRIQATDSEIVNYVQYSPTELSVVGQELGTTNLILWFEGESDPSIYEVTVVRDENIEEQRRIDFGRLEHKLAVMFPNSNVFLTPIGIQVHVRGQAADAKEADMILQVVRTEVISSYGRYGDVFNQASFGGGGGGGGLPGNGINQQFGGQFSGQNDIIVNDLTVPGAYNIMLRVIIAELNRNEQRDANVDLSVAFNNGRHIINSTLGAAGGNQVGGIIENGDVQAFIQWLQTNGTVSLLSEPTLVTMSGHPASLLGGGEFAVPTIIGLGGGQQTSFRGVGTSMVVTPTVVDRDLVRLQVQAEFSEISSSNSVNGIPGTSAKRVQTTVELREGQTLAIGGLMSRQVSTSVSRIPFLGDIPYIGTRLFHSRTSSEGDTELLVLVSPEIVNPMEPDEVPPLPNFYVTHPNDDDLWKYARTEGNPDQNVYQVQPFGSGSTAGVPQGYSLYNLPPAPAAQPYQVSPSIMQRTPGTQPSPGRQAPVQRMVPNHQPGNAGRPRTPLPAVTGRQQTLMVPQPRKPGLTSRLKSIFRPGVQQVDKATVPVSGTGWTR